MAKATGGICEEIKRMYGAHSNDQTMRDDRFKEIIATLDALTDEERVEVFGEYCVYCGTRDMPCPCWNDD